MLPSVNKWLGNQRLGQSVMSWFLHALLSGNPTARDMVDHVDLLNRYRGGQRCPAQTANLVTRLAPLCLPSPRTLWFQEVDGQSVWDALRPRPRSEVSDALLINLPRVLVFSFIDLEHSGCENVVGKKGYSRYDLRSALCSTAVGLALAVMEQQVKQNYDLEQWSTHFPSREAAEAWVHTNSVVPVLSPFAAMEELAHVSLDFWQQKSHNLLSVTIKPSTIDKFQGLTADAGVLLLPSTAEHWTPFVLKAQRVLTMISRFFRTIAVPRMPARLSSNNHFPSGQSVEDTVARELSAFSQESDMFWDFKYVKNLLGVSVFSSIEFLREYGSGQR